MSCFEKECLAKKQLTTTQEAVGEAMPNMQGDPWTRARKRLYVLVGMNMTIAKKKQKKCCRAQWVIIYTLSLKKTDDFLPMWKHRLME